MQYALPKLLLGCLLVLACTLQAATPEQSLLADAADGKLEQFSLLDAAVIAGGIHKQTEIVDARRRLEALWLEVGNPLIERLAVKDRPRAIFAALHRLVLTGKYRPDCTEVQTTLTSGDYNCVTATVLYLELCRRHGVEGAAMAIPAHVYCRLEGQVEQDVQTTCKEWFDVKAGKATSAAAQSLAKQIASGDVQPRHLTDVQLLGKVYYNRGVTQLEAHDYAAALALLKISLVLDSSDEPARNNLLAAYNNWALALCDAGDFAAAADKLAAGRAIDAKYGPLQTNDLYVHQKWVLDHCQRGRYSQAIEILEKGYERRPDADLFDGGRFAVYGMWARTLLEGNRLREALAVLDSARRRYGDHEELRKQEVQAFESGLSRLVQQGDTAAVNTMHTAAVSRHPEAASLRSLPAKQ